MKLFADLGENIELGIAFFISSSLERKRQQNEDKISHDAKKKREKEIADEEQKATIKVSFMSAI